MRNCRGNFQWDKRTKDFIKKIRARKFVEPPKLHLQLGRPSITKIVDGKLLQLTGEEIQNAGWKRK